MPELRKGKAFDPCRDNGRIARFYWAVWIASGIFGGGGVDRIARTYCFAVTCGKMRPMVFKTHTEETTDGGIISLGEYRPWSFHKDCGGNGSDWPKHSARTLDLKKKKAAGFTYFFDYLVDKIKKAEAIAVVPSHSPATGPTSGAHILAKRLAKALGIVDAGATLVRHKEIEKLAGGGCRDIDIHLDSVRVDNAGLIKGKVVILLDDVTTSGHSLRACKRKLLEAGAKEVKMLALGRTTH